MLKTWRWLALVGLTLAACSSGTAETGSPAALNVGPERAGLSSTPSISVPSMDTSSATSMARPSAETVRRVTDSGELALNLRLPTDVSPEHRAALLGYSDFLQ